MRRVAFTTVLVTIASGPLLAANFNKIAISGEPAPGAPAGANFSIFGSALIDAGGDVMFRATDSAGGSGIWQFKDGILQKVARSGDSLPGVPGTLGSIDPYWGMNAAGQIVFGSFFKVFTGKPGSLTLAVASGSPVPGMPGYTFGGLSNNTFGIDSGGQVAFYASLDRNLQGTESVWKWSSGSLSKILAEGDPAPGTEAGVTFSSVNLFTPLRMANGKVAVYARLTGPGISGANGEGIWLGDGNTLSLIARGGDPAPGGEQFAGVGPNQSGISALKAMISDAGDVIFEATLTSGRHGIFRSRNGSIESIVRSGDPAPGAAGMTFSNVEMPVVSSRGKIAFWADLAGAGGTRGSLWTWTDGVLKKIVSSDEHPAQMPAGFEFFRLGGTDQTKNIIFLNDKDQVIFGTGLDSSSGGSYSTLWSYDPIGGLGLLVGPNEMLELAPGDVRRISADVFVDARMLDGRFSGLNNLGQLAERLNFPVGSGVFLANVPEPSMLMFLTIAAVGVLGRRRR